MALKLRSKDACRIAGVDPLKLNEDIHAGHYQCAPATTAGSARLFDELDIIILTLWADLRRHDGVTRAWAGRIASSAHKHLTERATTEIDRLDMPLNVFDFMREASEGDPVDFSFPARKRQSFTLMSFDIKRLRESVREQMRLEAVKAG